MLYYVTGNSHKFQDAKRYLGEYGIKIEQKVLEIQEIQSDSVEEIAVDKAKKAYEILKKPLFVNDSGWYISALNGFPGPLMHYMSQWLSPQDFLNLMQGKENRDIILKQVNVYYDGTTVQLFIHERIGKIIEETKGEGRPIDCVTVFLENGLTIAEAKEQSIKPVDEEALWSDLAVWLKENSGFKN